MSRAVAEDLHAEPRWDRVVSLDAAHEAVVRALATGSSPAGLPAAQLFAHGTMKLYLYEPRGRDDQPVHAQDEVYVVLGGTGVFAFGEVETNFARVPFAPGDAIFVPAGTLHRFEDFSDDLTIWVVMYGPEGGETETSSARRPVPDLDPSGPE